MKKLLTDMCAANIQPRVCKNPALLLLKNLIHRDFSAKLWRGYAKIRHRHKIMRECKILICYASKWHIRAGNFAPRLRICLNGIFHKTSKQFNYANND